MIKTSHYPYIVPHIYFFILIVRPTVKKIYVFIFRIFLELLCNAFICHLFGVSIDLADIFILFHLFVISGTLSKILDPQESDKY